MNLKKTQLATLLETAVIVYMERSQPTCAFLTTRIVAVNGAVPQHCRGGEENGNNCAMSDRHIATDGGLNTFYNI